MWFVRIIVFVAALAVGIFFLSYTERIVNFIGHNSWAEKYLGAGGSYTMWRILGVIVMIMGFLYLIGQLDFFWP
jgi:hypothetical protein